MEIHNQNKNETILKRQNFQNSFYFVENIYTFWHVYQNIFSKIILIISMQLIIDKKAIKKYTYFVNFIKGNKLC